MKIHFFDMVTEKGMPNSIKNKFLKDGYRGARCGYMRRNTTMNENRVTCFYCLSKMKKQKCKV